MADFYHYYGQDLQLSATGDILTVSGTQEGQQRVIRRLLTNPYDYIWNVAYGAGVGQFVGQPGQVTQITAVVTANMYKETVVLQNPPPQISVTSSPTGTFELDITYTDAYNYTSNLNVPVGEN